MGHGEFLTGGSGALAAFLAGYLLLVVMFAALLGLGWALDNQNAAREWPRPLRYGRVFNWAFLGLLGALGGLPPFFFLGPKLALLSWLVGLGAWGSLAFMGLVLLVGWYVYWQGASALFNPSSHRLKQTPRLTRGGAALLGAVTLAPLVLGGFLIDLWLLACWIS